MNIPAALLHALQHIKGFDEKEFIAVHTSGEQVTSIRLNPNKSSGYKDQAPELEKVPWSSNGFYLPHRPSFTSDPDFHGGAYYVQEASSMFLEEAMKQTTDLTQPLMVLDLCAAPGGKSTLIQSIISKESILVSNELIRSRVSILSENLAKWGVTNVIVTNNDPKDFRRLPGYFDIIIVDAPCSGSGLFRKDHDAIEEWSLSNVEMCSIRQQRILEDVLPALKPSGILIYSTCSYSFEEDEAIADWLAEHGLSPVSLQIKDAWGIVESFSPGYNTPVYRFYPDKLKGEGFFITVFRNVPGKETEGRQSKNKFKTLSKIEMDIIKDFVDDINAYEFIFWNDEIRCLPKNSFNRILKLQSELYIKKAGIKIGTIKQGELVPHHELTVSTVLSLGIASVEVDLLTARDFLRRSEVIISDERKGWMVLKYHGLPLGWIKNLGHRINNYYPKEWRILNK